MENGHPGGQLGRGQRAAERPEGSYTVELLDDPAQVGEKVREEAEEVARAARDETDERVAEEAADVLYHLAVLMAERAPHEALPSLERTIAARRNTGDTGASYTARLFADPGFIGEKVQEEAEEVARAAREESDERVAEEAADVLYHLEVLLASRGLSLADAERVLNGRARG